MTSLSFIIALENTLASNPSPVPVHHFRIKRQFNPGFSPNSPNFQQQQQRPWGQQNPNLNGGLNAQRPPQGQFPFQGSSNLQGQSLSNQLLGNQQQQSSNNNLAGSVNSNQQGSTSTNNNNQAGSSNNNQQVLWSSNQSDYQCVINNCRGQSQWNPICGTDNLVYDNVAVLRCAQQCGRSKNSNKNYESVFFLYLRTKWISKGNGRNAI